MIAPPGVHCGTGYIMWVYVAVRLFVIAALYNNVKQVPGHVKFTNGLSTEAFDWR
jgi:hypothetical protein